MTLETNLMHGWAEVVESVALVAIVILATGLIVSAVKPSDATRHLGTILCLIIPLLMLPAIMATAWSSMSFWQHFAIVILGIVIGLSLRALRQARKRR
jgi:Mn2+/Fe2+ NRAMP family transporter